jgi:hypothetical protein
LYFKVLAVDDDALNEQAQDALARLEVGVTEGWPELFDDGFSARRTGDGNVGGELFGAYLGKRCFSGEAVVLGDLHPCLEGV